MNEVEKSKTKEAKRQENKYPALRDQPSAEKGKMQRAKNGVGFLENYAVI